jgi:hypothetical protein
LTRTLLLAAALLMPGVAVARPPYIHQLSECKSGWKPDQAIRFQYIPRQYLSRVYEGADRHTVIDMIDADGRLVVRVHVGETATFDCFDPPSGRCGPGETCT